MTFRVRWLDASTCQACTYRLMRYTNDDNTRQGYARKSILKPAGYLFSGA